MSQRLLLVRHATTADTRRAVFAGDGPLNEKARQRAAELATRLPKPRGVQLSPAQSARETAEAMGLEGRPEEAIGDWDFGSWTGSTLDEISAAQPDAAGAWLEDPSAAPHGGESLDDVFARVGRWLGAQAACEGTHLAITHAFVVRTAVVLALGAPPSAFWLIDVAPSSVSELRWRDGRWHLARLNWEPAFHHVPHRSAVRRRRGREATR